MRGKTVLGGALGAAWGLWWRGAPASPLRYAQGRARKPRRKRRALAPRLRSPPDTGWHGLT